jgi:hypothetical protein
MTTIDPFAHYDGAYALGALDDDDRRAFEAHLETCPDCQARVADLRATASLLALLPPSIDLNDLTDDPVDEPAPDTLLPRLLREAGRERARRRWLTAAVSGLAAAALVALAVVLWPGGSGTPAPAAQAFAAVRPSPLTATAQLVTKAWGTEIDLHCTYPASDNDRFGYNLVVIDKNRKPHDAGDWTLVPGRAGIDFTGGTSVPRDQIASGQITTPTGTPILELKL